MSFIPAADISSLAPGIVQVTEKSLFSAPDGVANFSDRKLIITTAYGTPLPNALADPPTLPLRTVIDWPIVRGTGDVLLVPTNLSWDVALSILIVYTPITPGAGSVYTKLITEHTCSYINKCYLDLTDKYYVTGEMTNNRVLVDLGARIDITMDSLSIAMQTGDLASAQMMLDCLQDLCLAGGNCQCY